MGLWHGANWTFVVWGALNAIYFLPLSVLKKNRTHTGTVAEGCIVPSLKEFLLMGSTFALTLLAWVFFRAESVTHAFEYCSGIFSLSLFSWPLLLGKEMLIVIGLVGVLLAMEWLQRHRQNVLELDKDKFPKVFRWGLYYGVAMAIVIFGARQHEFIYFQF